MNKTKLFWGVALACALTPQTAVDAQSVPGGGTGSASTTINITGTAQRVCVLPPPNQAASSSNASFSNSTVNLVQMVDPATDFVQPSSLSLQFPGAICNYNASLTLASKNGGMVSADGSNAANGSGAFLKNIPYIVNATWGGVNLTLDTATGNGNGTKATTMLGGANAGNLSLLISTAASTIPVVNGSYQDVLTIQIGAAL